jgi:AraC family L-rhamnose operon regulatory protein RhaS
MEKLTVDTKRGYTLPVYFEVKERLKEESKLMLKLVYVIEGSGIIKLNEQMMIFSAPAIFCISDLDKVELIKGVNLEAQAVYFDPIVIDDFLQLSAIRKEDAELSSTQYRDYFLILPFMDRQVFKTPYIEIGPITSKRVAQLFKGIEVELTFMENEFWPCRSRSFLLEILFLIQNMTTDLKDEEKLELPRIPEDISPIVLYLHTNYNKKITIEELTDEFHINRTTLSGKFKKSMGITIIDYLIKLRIKMASIMLRDTLLPVSEILTRVGFNDSVHFSRMFKRCMGCTPSVYREKYMVI